jgi:hypothetical protein
MVTALIAGRAAYALVLAVAVAVTALAVAVHGAPVPHIHDEFTYLFAGETYANFRLAFPSPPSPESFWSPHLLVEPTFASKYPPGQGLALAIGYWTGDPLFGLLLTGIVAAITLLWALRAVVGPIPALVTALCFAGSALFLGVWIRTYMGGMVAFSGAALVLGSCLRMHRHTPTRLAYLALGIGTAALFLSRPFEGAIVCILAGILYANHALRQFRNDSRRVATGVLIATLPLLLAFGFQAAVNHAVTGSAWRMPHPEFHAQYMTQPIFIWQEAQPARKPSPAVAEAEQVLMASGGWAEHIRESLSGAFIAASAVSSPWLPWLILLSLPFLALLEWRLLVVLAGFPLLHALSNYLELHFYFGPIAPIWFLAIATMFEYLATRLRQRGVAAALMLLALACLVGPGLHEAPSTHGYRHHHDLKRALAQRAPSLVFVRYGATANPHLAIVYNDPALRNHTLFVNELDESANCTVLANFGGREVWRVAVEDAGMQAAMVEPGELCPSMRASPAADHSAGTRSRVPSAPAALPPRGAATDSRDSSQPTIER